jgi:hypothetical protein
MDMLDDFLTALAVHGKAQRERAMIYQVDMKERAAIANGLDMTAYYELPYAEWAVIRSTYLDSVYLDKTVSEDVK